MLHGILISCPASLFSTLYPLNPCKDDMCRPHTHFQQGVASESPGQEVGGQENKSQGTYSGLLPAGLQFAGVSSCTYSHSSCWVALLPGAPPSINPSFCLPSGLG